MRFDEYRYAVSKQMLTIYGIDWDDACGDDEPLLAALDEGAAPEDFVDWFGRKHDLDPLWLFGLEPPRERIAKLSRTRRGRPSDRV
tara:strand:- start:594 stop:851 length:258 start_codon:yes stop_codon:yes gene_type:complete